MPSDLEFVNNALSAMAKRGPDAASTIHLAGGSLANRRLAITDVENGHQPFLNQEHGIAAVFNGAIYNHKSLRTEHDIGVTTGNDGDVIIPLFIKFGLHFADYLDGMFSIILLDERNERMVVANDRFGIKPLYIAKDENTFMAASTLACFPTEVRCHVRRLLPGTVLSSAGESAQMRVGFSMPGATASLPIEVCRETRSLALDALDAALQEEVVKHIPEEVPWGCLLSGGVDSSLIASLAAKTIDQPLTTLCAGVEGSEDIEIAARVAREFGFDHVEVIIDKAELLDLVRRSVLATESYDPGIVLNGIGVLCVARAARSKGIKVVMSGEGADEVFAGYDEHVASPSALLRQHLLFDQSQLGSSECLRLDRCAMEFGVEARVPFLSASVVRIARRLPPNELIRREGDSITRKSFLRSVAARHLPKFVAEREKVPFFQGAGLYDGVVQRLEREAPNFKDTPIPFLPNGLKKYPDLDLLAGYCFSIWKEGFHEYLDDWSSLEERGLVRRRFNPFDAVVNLEPRFN